MNDEREKGPVYHFISFIIKQALVGIVLFICVKMYTFFLAYRSKRHTSIAHTDLDSTISSKQKTEHAFQKEPTTEKHVDTIFHKQHYNVRVAAQSYSNIAAVLAGFAFAAVVFVMQTQLPPNYPGASFLRDWTTIAFFIAFFGCILSAFIFAVISGEEVLAPRTNMIAFFGGIGFSIATSLMFWSIVTLTKIFLDSNIVTLSRVLYLIFTFVQPLFLAFSALDNIISFGNRQPTSKEWLQVFSSGCGPIIIASCCTIVLYLSNHSLTTVPLLWCAVLLSVSCIIISSVIALWVSDKPHEFNLSVSISSLVILVHSLVLALLILTI